MHIQDIFAQHKTTYSFEFFPPKTEKGWANFYENFEQLKKLNPTFVDVTYGAGGGTRDNTWKMVMDLHHNHGVTVVPHMTTVQHNEEEVTSFIEGYAREGVDNILALSGDAPKDDPNYDRTQDAFQYAEQLVRWLRDYNKQGKHANGKGFGVGVAGFPEGHHATQNRMEELAFLKQKSDLADYICTQFCFDTNDILDWRERLEIMGVTTPVIVGIMPITSYQMYEKLPQFGLGAKYPAKLMNQIEKHKDDDAAIQQIGIDWMTEQCQILLDNDVRGLHFYTLNKAEATVEIFNRLGLAEREAAGKA
jgi:methylenetetrahydrofolate reductase (NADPH)